MFGDYLADRRTRLGLSTEELSVRAHIRHARLRYLEAYRTAKLPSPSEMAALAVALEVTVAALLEAAGYHEPPGTEGGARSSPRD